MGGVRVHVHEVLHVAQHQRLLSHFGLTKPHWVCLSTVAHADGALSQGTVFARHLGSAVYGGWLFQVAGDALAT